MYHRICSSTEYGREVLFVLETGKVGGRGEASCVFTGGRCFSPGLSKPKAVCFLMALGNPLCARSTFQEGSGKTSLDDIHRKTVTSLYDGHVLF